MLKNCDTTPIKESCMSSVVWGQTCSTTYKRGEGRGGSRRSKSRRSSGRQNFSEGGKKAESFIATPRQLLSFPRTEAIEPPTPRCCPPHDQGPYGRSHVELRHLRGDPMPSPPMTSRRSMTPRSRRRYPTSPRRTSSQPSQDT